MTLRSTFNKEPTKPGWYIHHGQSGIRLWWCGSIEKVLIRRSDQQWSIQAEEATGYDDLADAINAAMVLGDGEGLTIFRVD